MRWYPKARKVGLRRNLALVAAALVCYGPLVTCVAAQTKSSQTNPKAITEATPLIYSLKGPDLFHAYCAPCHGTEAKGDGPVALALKSKVPDLTVLAKNNKLQFPSTRVRRIITGDQILAAHGSREMPIWGPIFHQIESDQDFGNVRIENLTKYLGSIQQK